MFEHFIMKIPIVFHMFLPTPPQVFKKAYIPRTLDQVINFERDFYKQKKGEESEVGNT
jgi:hypothetical protein